jgi:hypothetical protein
VLKTRPSSTLPPHLQLPAKLLLELAPELLVLLPLLLQPHSVVLVEAAVLAPDPRLVLLPHLFKLALFMGLAWLLLVYLLGSLIFYNC